MSKPNQIRLAYFSFIPLLILCILTISVGCQNKVVAPNQTKKVESQQPVISYPTEISPSMDKVDPDWNRLINQGHFKYTIYLNGKVKLYKDQKVLKTLKLLSPDFDFEKVFYTFYKNDLILIYQETNYDEGGSSITRISPETRKELWNTPIGAFNLGKPVIEGSSIYLNAIGFVGKLNMETGKFIWKDDDLWDVNDFDKVNVNEKYVEFYGHIGIQEDAIPFIYDKYSGKRIK